MSAGKRIVIIDDDPIVVKIVSDILSHLGHGTQTFTMPHEALDYILSNSERVRLVISDNDMPGMQGTELLQRIHATHPGLPLLMVSACPPPVLDAGVAFLAKPFRIESLNRSVSEALADKSARRRPGSDQADVA